MRSRRVHLAGTLILTAAAVSGCQRPPEPPAAGAQGPPQLVHVDPKTPEGKALAAVRLQPHENFIVPPVAPAASATNPAPAPDGHPPAAIPVTPAPAVPPPAAAAPTAPATGPPAAQPPKSGAVPPVAAPGGPPISGAAPAAGSQLATQASEASRKAHQYGSGLYATPLGALMFAKDKVKTFGVENALQLYVVEHGKPRDTAEFIEKVVKANGLSLPPLPEGQKYYYKSDEGPNGTLMIEVPKK